MFVAGSVINLTDSANLRAAIEKTVFGMHLRSSN